MSSKARLLRGSLGGNESSCASKEQGRQRIGAVARALNLTPRRLIEYERAGLVCPVRDPRTNDRLYNVQDIELLHRIVKLIREKQFTLAGLRELFRCAPCWVVLDCPYRYTCPVPQNGLVRCYEQRAACVRTPRQADCTSCPVYRCSVEIDQDGKAVKKHG